MAVTLHEIAQRLGIHKSTVSRVLSGSTQGSYISERRRQQILDTAAEMGFRPNALARAVRTGRTHQIGVFAATAPSGPGGAARLAHDAAADFLVGINARLAAGGYVMVLRGIGPEERSLADVRELRERVFDGLIVVGVAGEEIREQAEEAYPACVWADANVWRPERCIRRDEEAAGRLAAERLADLGCRRVLYTVRPEPSEGRPHYSEPLRLAGVRAGAEARGLAFEAFRSGPGVPTAEAADALRSADPETAVVAYSAYDALRLQTLCADLRLRPGEDFALACCDSMPLFRGTWPGLARVEFDRWSMGHAAADMALAALDDPAAPPPSRLVLDGWIDGATAPPRNTRA